MNLQMSLSQPLLDDSDLEDELFLIALILKVTGNVYSTIPSFPSMEASIIQQQQQINALP